MYQGCKLLTYVLSLAPFRALSWYQSVDLTFFARPLSERRELVFYSSDSCYGFESNLIKCNVRLINTKESNPSNHFRKSNFKSNNAKNRLLCQSTELPPKYFILGKFRKPWLVPKATCPSLPKLHRLGNLGMRGEGPEMSIPARPIKDRPLLTWYVVCENTCVLILIY